MTSADSLRQVLLRSSNSVRKASQGKNTIFPVIYPPHLHREFRIAWGFSFFGNLTHSHMPDAVPVRRTNGLPRASFRFHLTMDTLAFGYALGAIPCARDFHSLDCAHAWHTKKALRTDVVRRAFFPCVRSRGFRRSPRELIGRSMGLKIRSGSRVRRRRCGSGAFRWRCGSSRAESSGVRWR